MVRRIDEDGDDSTSLYEPPEGPLPELPPLRHEPGDRYVLAEVLGRGGMGEVLAAEDSHLARPVALKRLTIDDPRPHDVHRFLNEARLTGRLDHPGVPPVHDVGVGPDGAVFFTMKRVVGRSLSEHLERGELSLVRRLEVFLKICDAVAYAHAHGVLHRDLKPGNVMVGDYGEVYVLDWGLAKQLDVEPKPGSTPPPAAPRTDPHAVLGTPAFMPPEQAQGAIDDLDERSDVYALGAVLYAMLTGASPFPETGRRVLERLRTGARIGPPSAVARHTPWELDAVVGRATEPRKEARYASVEALREDVRRYLEGRPIAGAPYGPMRTVRRWTRRYRRTGLAVLSVTFGVGGIVLVLLLLTLGAVVTARDRALGAERDARDALVEARLALADARLEAGRPLEAERALDAAGAVASDADGRRISLARSALRYRHPPADLSFRASGELGAVLSPDGSRVLALDGQRVIVRAFPHGRILVDATLEGTVLGAVPTETGARVAVHVPGAYRVVDLPGGDGVREWPAPTEARERDRILLSADGAVVVRSDPVVGTDSWRFADGEPAGPSLPGAIVLAVSADGARLLGEVPGGVQRAGAERVVWETASGRELLRVPNGGTAALSADGRTVAVVADGWLEVRAVDGGAVRFRTPASDGRVTFVDRDRIAVGGPDHALRTWAADSGRPGGTVPLAVSPGVSRGTLAGAAFAPVLAASVDGLAEARALPVEPEPAEAASLTSLDLGGDGVLALVGVRDEGVVRIVDWRTRATVRELPVGPAGVRQATFDAGERRVITAGRDGTVRAFDPATGASLWTAALAADRMVVSALPLGDEVLAVMEDGQLVTIGAGGEVVRREPGGIGSPWSATVSPDGVVAVTGRGRSDPLVELRAPGGAPRGVGRGTAYRASFSPDGRWLAIGTGDGAPALVEVATGEVRRLPSYGESAQAVAFSPDGELLAVGTYDGRLALVSLPDGETLASVPMHAGSIVDLAFAGRTVVTASGDGTLGVFDLDGASAWARLGRTLEPGEEPPGTEAERWRDLGEAALLRGDARSAVERFRRAQAAGGEVDRLSLVRASWATGLEDAARDGLAVEIDGVSDRTREIWR